MSCLAQDVANSTLMRFLRARGMNVPKASKLYCDDVKWREEYLPVKPEEVESEIKTDKSFIVDKPGERPWVYMFAKNHDTTVRDIEQFKSKPKKEILCSVDQFKHSYSESCVA